jgi:tetratricopeptide (TPR) repeat protein
LDDNIYQSKEFKDYLHKYEAACSSGSSVYLEPDELTNIAEYYHLHGHHEDALKAVDLAIQMFPGATQPLAFRARYAILMKNDTEEAMRYADMIEDKHDLDYYYMIAEIMIADNREQEADTYLKDKEEVIDDESIDDFVLDVATLFADYDKIDLAQKWLAKSNDTDEPDYKELQGIIAMSKGNYDESERIFNNLIDDNPYSVPYWNQLASSQYLRNDPAASVESSGFSLAIDPEDPDAVINKANGLLMLGNQEEALKYYQLFKRLQPQSEIGDMGIGAIMTSQNRMQEALIHYERAESICSSKSTNLTEIYRQEFLINAALSRFDKAVAYIEKLRNQPNISESELAILQGYIDLLRDDTESAKAWFDKAVETAGPDTAKARLLIAYSAYDCNYVNISHDIIYQMVVVEGISEFAEGWAFLTLCDFDLGLRHDFLEHLHHAIDFNIEEAGRMLSFIFPEDINVNQYYSYALAHPDLGTLPKENMKG